jgi:murein DD-endopeptidase MepM/ murein hydrolase activator NlpD
MVIIKHGQFFTVYSHLESASVSKGQKVKTGDAVGTSSLNDEGMAEVHFELWKDKNKQNPESWLRRK